MKEENLRWPETKETAQLRIEQARRLKKQARDGGLKFEAFLPSDIAEWVLEMVEQGEFIDPSEAVFVLMKQAKELHPHRDLRKELLKRSIEEGAKGPFIDGEEAMESLRKRIESRTETVIWQKIDQDYKL